MLNHRLPSLLSWQICNAIVRRRQQQIPNLVPAMLRSCVFHLSRITRSHIASFTPVTPYCQSSTTTRNLSTSFPFCVVKKSTRSVRDCSTSPFSVVKENTRSIRSFSTSSPLSAVKKKTSDGSEKCQVFDQSQLLVGQMTVREAEQQARKENMKLVDMGVNADGVRSFRLVTGQELAEESKQQRLEKKSKVKEKEFRVTSNISDHDLGIKMRQAKDMLDKGQHVKFIIKAAKRARTSQTGSQLSKKVINELGEQAVMKQGIHTEKEQQLLFRPKAPPQSPER